MTEKYTFEEWGDAMRRDHIRKQGQGRGFETMLEDIKAELQTAANDNAARAAAKAEAKANYYAAIAKADADVADAYAAANAAYAAKLRANGEVNK